MLLTDVAGVFDGWGLDHPALLRELPAATARAMPLAAGSMGPKVEAACRFAESGGRAVIGAMEDAAALVAGTAGTEVVAAGLSAVRR